MAKMLYLFHVAMGLKVQKWMKNLHFRVSLFQVMQRVGNQFITNVFFDFFIATCDEW
jgi:hypothetical protein